MSCERLDVVSHRLADGKTSQEMLATQRVTIESQEFWGRADEVKYDESKEQVILVGKGGNLAVLEREKVQGGQRETIKGEKITYWRLTGTYRVEGAKTISVSP